MRRKREKKKEGKKGKKKKTSDESNVKSKLPDYYKILGVPVHASYKDINKAYQNIALIHHPDRRNPEGDVYLFNCATEAKNTLSDPASRLAYNRKLALESVKTKPVCTNKFVPKKRVHEDYNIKLEINLKEVMNGAEKEINIRRKQICSECNGLGSDEGEFYQCDKCNGHGLLSVTFDDTGNDGDGNNNNNEDEDEDANDNSDNGKIEATGDCFYCGGIGVHRHKKGNFCSNCKGAGVVNEDKTLKVSVPPGITSKGHNIRIKQAGHCIVNGLPGDILIHITPVDKEYIVKGESFTFGNNPQASPCDVVIKRRDIEQNLFIEQQITLEQSLMGFSVRFKHLDGTELSLTPIKTGYTTQNNHGRVLKNGGLPLPPGFRNNRKREEEEQEEEGISRDKTVRGTLTVRYVVVLPDKLSENGKKEITKILANEPINREIENKRVDEINEFVKNNNNNNDQQHNKKRKRTTDNDTDTDTTTTWTQLRQTSYDNTCVLS